MIDLNALLGQAETILQPWAGDVSRPEANRMDIRILPDHLPMAVQALLTAHWGYFAALTGLDLPASIADPAGEGSIEGLYHFCEGAAVVTLRVLVPYSNAQIPSLCGLIPSAALYEREFSEMFGVSLPGTTMTTHLLLADDWPEGVYPLRKSFVGLKALVETEAQDE